MNTKDLLLKLAGNDHQKQSRAEQWNMLLWLIDCDITEAQGKVLLNEPCPDEEGGTIYALEHAINLREPVFLKTTVDLLWSTDAMYLCKVLDVLNEDAQRQLLKTPDTFKSLMVLINEVEHYRDNVPEYILWCPDKNYDINSVYRAAWYILDAYGGDYLATVTERYSLKKLKAALKTPERIDRYAQVEHIEYDYSKGYLRIVKVLVESAAIPEFEPIWFSASEDIAAEGVRMHNCIANYWNQQGIVCCIFACIYKGTRIDVEVRGELLNVRQCYEHSNGSSALTDELTNMLQEALNPLFEVDFIFNNVDTTVYLYDAFGFGDLKHKCVRYSAVTRENDEYGRYLVDTDTLKVFRISTVAKNTIRAFDISTFAEGLAVRGLFCITNSIPNNEDFDANRVELFEDFYEN